MLTFGNVFDGFQIYNKKAGTTKSINTTSDKPQITEGNHTTWHIVKPQQTEFSNAACFKADNTQFLNHQGDNTLGYWSDADQGSSCRFFKPAAIAMEPKLKNSIRLLLKPKKTCLILRMPIN